MGVDVSRHLGLVGHVLARLPRGMLCHLPQPDVHAEASLALVLASKSYDPARGAFSTFAIRVIENHLRSLAIRRHWHAVGLDGIDVPEAPEQSGAEPDDLARLRSTLAGMPPRRARALLLVIGEERTYAEVSDAMGLSRQRVMQMVRRGLEQLRDAFGLTWRWRRPKTRTIGGAVGR